MKDHTQSTESTLPPGCVSIARLLPLLDSGDLDDTEMATVREHIISCKRCQTQLAQLAVVEDALRRNYGDEVNGYRNIALADVIRTAEIEADADAYHSHERAQLPHVFRNHTAVFSRISALAAVFVIALLIALILGHMASRDGIQHPKPTAGPKPSGKIALSVTQFNYYDTASVLNEIATGPDGNLWVANEGYPAYPGAILRITPAGKMTEYWLASGHIGVKYMAVGGDGNMWFTEDTAIGRITMQGMISEFPLPKNVNFPNGIATGPDGNVWFTATDSSNRGIIGRVNPQGRMAIFPVTTPNMTPGGITAGPDGAIWFTEETFTHDGQIGRITPDGSITEYPIATAGSGPTNIVAGPDGNLWFTESGVNKIGRMTTDGAITEFILPTANGAPTGIIAGPDGYLWFIETGNGPDQTSVSSAQIGRISTAGAIREYSLPTASRAVLAGLAFDSRGRLWMTFGQNLAVVARVDSTL